MKTTSYLYLLVSTIFLINCKQAQEKPQEVAFKDVKKELVSIAKEPIIKVKGNVTEVYQHFTTKNLESNQINLGLENASGAMLSAYSLDTSNYVVYYRQYENDGWSNWKEMIIDEEANNPKRKVFQSIPVINSSTKIQFKSNQPLQNEVVFRLYKFLKNN